MNRREFLKKSSVLGALSCIPVVSCTLNNKPAQRPNIIFLLADDQRWDTLGCMGNSIIQTPNLDKLAQKGVLFKNNFVTYSYCAPSRASFLSGVYYDQHKIARKRKWDDGLFEQTYPMLLKKAGYRTGFLGKWHMGATKDKSFDYFWGFSGQGKYINAIPGDKRHLTTILTDKSIEFFKDSKKDQPFCLSVSFKAPHVDQSSEKQFLYDPELDALYKDVTIPPANDTDFEKLPDFIQTCEARKRWQTRFSRPELYQEMVKGYYRLISGIDRAVGRIVASLKSQGLDKNTIIIFTGDNGFFLGEHGLAGKWLMYEQAIRTPLIVFDPRLQKSELGKKRDEMTLNVDIAPTIMEMANVEIPKHIKGKSLLPLVYNKKTEWRKECFYQHYAYGGRPRPEKVYIPQCEGIRTQQYKYIQYIDQDPVYEQLFDLANDPDEVNNLVSDDKYKDILNNLRQRFDILRKNVKKP